MIWYDFVDIKFYGEYLTLYLRRQSRLKLIFKLVTIILSAGGIFSAFKELKEFTIFYTAAIGLVQLASLVENLLFHSDKDIQQLCKLQSMYLIQEQELEKMFVCYEDEPEQTTKERFFKQREFVREIAEVDKGVRITIWKSIDKAASKSIFDHLKKYTQ